MLIKIEAVHGYELHTFHTLNVTNVELESWLAGTDTDFGVEPTTKS